jgi:hypothetical protein
MDKFFSMVLFFNVVVSLLLERCGNTDSAIYTILVCIFIVLFEQNNEKK